MTSAVNTRELILGILLEITQNGTFSHLAIANVLGKYQYLEKQERAFITRVTEGTLEQGIRLDYLIDHFSKVPVRKMKPVIRCIIQSAAYQICYMDAVPNAAACNEAVKLAKKRGFSNLAGFVNGVLRSISRGHAQVALPDRNKEPEQYLSICYSIPVWMIQMWKKQLFADELQGTDCLDRKGWEKLEQMLQAFQAPAPLYIRLNPNRCTRQQLLQQLQAEGVSATILEQLPYALQLTSYDYLSALQSFQDGLFYVQDLSSMLAMDMIKPKEGDFVLDVCAAPGGKALHMAWALHGTGRVLARDLTEEKASLLEENKRRCQAANMDIQVWDATVPDTSLYGQADFVIADLPCSGLGVIRRKKDIRYHVTEAQCEELVKLQRTILTVVCNYVKPGGRLVYSTCTMNRRENEENVEWFCSRYQQFQLISSRQWLPCAEGGDGFYCAILERKGWQKAEGFVWKQ